VHFFSITFKLKTKGVTSKGIKEMVGIGILRERRMIACTVIGIAAIVFLLLWFFSADFSTSLVEYLNKHGGFALLFLYGATLATSFVTFVRRDTFLLFLFAFVALLALVASFVGMAI